MRNDIITATLPVDPVEAKFTALVKHWGPFEVVRAAHDNGAPLDCDLWGLPLLIAVEEQLTQEAAQAANMRMLDADAPKPAAPAPAAEDPLAEVRDAIITALAAASIEGGERANKLRLSYILGEVRKLLAPPLAAGQIHRVDPAQFEERNGLLVEHKPGARAKGGAL